MVEKREVHLWHPPWWHHQGKTIKLAIVTFPMSVTLKGKTSSLEIQNVPDMFGKWLVDWNLTHTLADAVRGRVLMSTEELWAAFIHQERVPEGSEWLIERFGATAAVQRKFIRYEDFLNIPYPGTGHDGDPNISIRLTPKIKTAVQRMIEARRTKPSEESLSKA